MPHTIFGSDLPSNSRFLSYERYKLVELEIVDEVSHETICSTLKKNEIKSHLKQQWCIPPEHSGDFVARMDEQPVQFLKETRTPIPATQGQPAREDYEYERNGTGSVFLFTEAFLKNVRDLCSKNKKALFTAMNC